MDRRKFFGLAAVAALPWGSARAQARAQARAAGARTVAAGARRAREMSLEHAWLLLRTGAGTREQLRCAAFRVAVDERQKSEMLDELIRACPEDFVGYVRAVRRERR